MSRYYLSEAYDDERATIVTKYELGRCDNSHIYPWEDPGFEVYHVTDRYGFLHDHRLPEKLTAHETKVREIESERLNKWLKMLKNWDKYYGGEKFKRRMYKGIPNAVRGEVWCRMLNVMQVKKEQEGKYIEMREKAKFLSPDIKQIDLDVNRTYRNHIMFRERYSVKQQALFNVLAAYSVYNMEIGYCQGMSQIAALLLMYMNEEDSFWALSRIMSDDKHAMHGFFIPGFPKLQRFQEHHDKILTCLISKLKKHLDKYEIHTSLYTLKWFFQCFLDRVPFTLTLRLWDIYIYEGESVLTAMSYTLLKLHRKTLLKMNMEELVEFLQVKLEQDFGYHDDAAVDALQASMEELHKHKLDHPGRAPPHELPQKPFGLIETFLQQKREVCNGISDDGKEGMNHLMTNDKVPSPVWKRRDESDSENMTTLNSKAAAETDNGSSIVDPLSSRNSLAETSQTSVADLSALSGFSSPSTTLTRHGDIICSKQKTITRPSELRRTLSMNDNIAGPRTHSPDAAIRVYVPYESFSKAPSSSTLLLDHSPSHGTPPNGDITPTNQDPNKITIHVSLDYLPNA
ncbi:USP6 N-terminal-like protein [Parasteatoda tepidariorum]|uniref:USP6 N-terminal-like protein n=1 Tax=Parasteatoda tepidariorum TaxID=114398 RepID=UPI00077F8C1C|nr:USP6 N-terminal-like protein [Parasteatoda tepidariorum]XP_015905574.1 USP6 N-terminal-like protein [Parasteatoda tepidariorum]XP_015905575.1 USP6 N-terminal-like protein [Parasteatoda tepidariorum]XP_015905576.1 USP6 N-terminal-like protein [Parasteatoda tepidariorum]XP_015905577.1 USP6 N-terminal-like protein [Parasteatoda tepidariorum]XP_042907731.1 USP6 N-terminal-like protein [Parasteatoda tepidariorum]